MNKLDFLSEAPNTLIFGQKSNKTLLGGVLTVIYLIVILLITVAYLYDYGVNIHYSVLYTSDHDVIYDAKDIDNKNKYENLNPTITFNIKGNNINHTNFAIYKKNGTGIEEINFGIDYESKVYDLYFLFVYRCAKLRNDDFNCTIREEDKEASDNGFYLFTFNHTGFKIDHANIESPIKKVNILDYFMFNYDDKITFNTYKWKVIKYTEEKGLFGTFENLMGKSNVFYGGELIESRMLISDIPQSFINLEKNGMKAFGIAGINDINDNYIDIYTRSTKSIFDPISCICSLSMTIFHIFVFAFSFYSNNFDNYKIIEKVISRNKKPFTKKNIEKNEDNIFDISNNSEKKDVLLELNSNDDEDNEDNILNNKKEEEKEIQGINDDEFEDIKMADKESRFLPKLSFFDFIFNNIYKKNCCLSNKQELVSICNNLISEYYTIDNIIYNQLKLENLFKDYKWNKPELNTIENNKIINNLKSFI